MSNTDRNVIKSSVDNPIAFFEEFFPKGLLYEYSKYSNVEGIVEYEETIGFDEKEHFTKLETPVDVRDICLNQFEELLPTELKKQVNVSIKCTNDALLKKDTEDSQKRFIHLLFVRVINIIENNINVFPKKTQKVILEILIAYMQKINNLYPDLVSKRNTVYKKYLFPTQKSSTLKMKEDKLKYLPDLHNDLINGNFIEQNLPYELFEKAFSGCFIEEPLNIKWIKIRGKKMNYIASLMRMLIVQEKNGIIEPYKLTQLPNIFVRKNGTDISLDSWKDFGQKEKGYNNILSNIEDIAKNFYRK